MKSGKQVFARDYIASLAAAGRYWFASDEARKALGVSADAVKLALNRLARQKIVASPARGFYVILPPEYQSLGCLPADQFIPALMQHFGQSYYVGLLSAAQYYGAAHHRPQEFQVMVAKARRKVSCGQVRVAYILRKRLKDVPVQSFNTPRGTLLVSTPEATAIDLVGYHHHAGGMEQVATILAELAEQIDVVKLVESAKTAPVSWSQRLGYLLEYIGVGEQAALLKSHVRKTARDTVMLLPGSGDSNAKRDKDWKLIINAELELEI